MFLDSIQSKKILIRQSFQQILFEAYMLRHTRKKETTICQIGTLFNTCLKTVAKRRHAIGSVSKITCERISMYKHFLFSLLLLFLGATANASESCITKNLDKSFIAENDLLAIDTSVFVLLDQTTPMDDNLKSKLKASLADFLKGKGDVGYTLDGYSYSSFLAGQYMQHDLKGVLHEQALSEKLRNQVVKKDLKSLDSCQKTKATQVAIKKLDAFIDSVSLGDEKLVKSDIMESLSKAANEVSKSKAQNKVVVIYSDMLENSSITSFYASNAVRKIDHQKELALAEKAGMFADFGGARVYVMGAGLVSETGKAKGVYRDPKMIQSLRAFWTEWFKRSNAELLEFGTPEMLGEIK